MQKNKKNQGGFTLIEVLVVIGIIAVLAAVVLIAINPARQFKAANDSQRSSNVNAILNAVGQYLADNKGSLPTGLNATDCGPALADACDIAKAAVMTDKVDLCTTLVPTYIPSLPVDPLSTGGAIASCVADYDSGYQAYVDAQGRVTIVAPDTQLAATDISVTR